MNKEQQLLGTEPIGKLLLKYSLPAIIGMMVNGLYNVVDRIFIGNIPDVGPIAITGVGVTTPIVTLILAFSMLVGLGSVTNISIKLGQGRKDDAEKIIGNALFLGVAIGLVLTIIGLTFQNQILQAFGASAESLPYAKAYINIILIGSTLNIIAFILNSIIRGDGNPKLAAMMMIIGCGLNIVLDAVFIFGFNMGIQGAAFATVISQAVTAVIGLRYFIGGKSNLKFRKSSLKLESHLVKSIFAIGCAPFAMQLAASLTQVISNNALKAHGGDMAIGAMATMSSISIMILMPIAGLTQGAQPIVGYNYGAGQYGRSKQVFSICMKVALLFLIPCWILIQCFPEVIVRMFNGDPELMAITIDGLRKYLCIMPTIAISYMGSNYIQSIGKAKLAMVLSLLRQVLLFIPILLILPNILGLDGIWFAQPLADAITATITTIVIIREFKTYKK